jgi:hypothetical protein
MIHVFHEKMAVSAIQGLEFFVIIVLILEDYGLESII